MKKLLVLILALAVVFSLVACKVDCEKNGHIDDDKNGVCDRCEQTLASNEENPSADAGNQNNNENNNQNNENTENGGNGSDNNGGTHVHKDENTDGKCDGCEAIVIDYTQPTVVGTVLVKSIEKQLQGLESFRIEFDIEKKLVYEYWFDVYDDDLEEYVLVNAVYTEIDINTYEIDVVKSGDNFNAKIVQTLKNDDTRVYDSYFDEENDVYEESTTSYIIDGYKYNELADGMYTKELLDNSTFNDILGALTSVELPEEQKTELLDALGAEIAFILDIKDSKGALGVDLKNVANEVLNYIIALDFETDTVESVVNDVLKLVSDDLTAELLLIELERVSALSVDEALVELDTWLVANFDATLQDLFDAFVADPTCIEMFKQFLISVNELDPEDPEIQAQLDSVVESMKTFNIAAYIEEAGVGSVTLYELLTEATELDIPESAEEFFTTLRAVLALTLAELDENMDGRLSMIKMMAETIRFEKLEATLDVNFKNVLEIDSIEGYFGAVMFRTQPSDYEGKTETYNSIITATFKLFNLNGSDIDASMDESLDVIDADLIKGYYENDNGWVDLYYYSYGDGNVFVAYDGGYYDATNEAYFNFSSEIPLADALADVVVLTNLTIFFNGEVIDVSDEAVIKMVIDCESDTFEIVEFPEIDLPSLAYLALQDLVYNTTWSEYSIDGSNQIGGSGPEDVWVWFEDYDLEYVAFSVEEGAEENILIATITGLCVDSDHPLRRLDGVGFYGATFDEETVNAYFNGDPTFVIEFDPETGIFYFVDLPEIDEAYRDEWDYE